MRICIGQTRGEVATLLKAEAKKNRVLIGEIAEKTGIRRDILDRRLNKKVVELELIEIVLKAINEKLEVRIIGDEKGEIELIFEKRK